MITHFANLVYWKELKALYCEERDIIELDSISITWIAGVLGLKKDRKPGTLKWQELVQDNTNYFVFSDQFRADIESEKQYALPYFEKLQLSCNMKELVMSLPSNTNVIIGIGSPKQNIIATEFYEVRNDLNYFCLGAAIGVSKENFKVNKTASKIGLEWLMMLLANPHRGIKKIEKTLVALLEILIIPKMRREFKIFMRQIKS